MVIDDPFVFELGVVTEVDQEPHFEIGRAEIVENLSTTRIGQAGASSAVREDGSMPADQPDTRRSKKNNDDEVCGYAACFAHQPFEDARGSRVHVFPGPTSGVVSV